jgi:tRNA dimethylallyltransferase
MKKQKYLIVIGGPTASGKTGVAIKIAQHFQTEILSADSRQFYREMSIGTAKPTKNELAAIKHHLVNFISVHENFTVGDFERKALKILDHLFLETDVVVLTGGSGLYIRALCEGLDQFPEVPSKVRIDLIEQYEKEGIEYLQKELADKDPDYFKIVDIQNPQRLIRALEVCIASGASYSSFRKKANTIRSFKTINIQLEWERAALYDRINHRVDNMIKAGLIEEARNLYPMKQLNALQTVGYQELFDYFDKKITLEEAVELIKRNSRRYAKRQLTWMRKDGFWKGFTPDQIEEMIAYIKKNIGLEQS